MLWLISSLCIPCVRAQQGDVRRVHDPHIVQCKDAYYVFSTGPGIPIRRSMDLLNWEKVGTVFERVPEWASQEIPGVKDIWAADASFYNKRYQLYYSVSTFGKNRSCIGLAVNATLDPASKDYKWVDMGKVVESRPPQDNWNAIDANFIADEQNQSWLVWGSFWSGIKLQRLDPSTGKLLAGSKMISIATRRDPPSVEAPYIVRREGYSYLFVSFDQCCKGVESTYRIMVGRAKNIVGPYLNRAGKPMLEGGATQVLAGYGEVRGPGHCSVLTQGGRHWLVHHFYDAANKGAATLQIRPIIWDEAGWPLPGEPIAGAVGAGAGAGGGVQRDARDPRDARDGKSVAGDWLFSVDFSEDCCITLHADGKITKSDSEGAWERQGNMLLLKWPKQNAAGAAKGDVWRDKCFLSDDGSWFVGSNLNGSVIRGRRAPSR